MVTARAWAARARRGRGTPRGHSGAAEHSRGPGRNGGAGRAPRGWRWLAVAVLLLGAGCATGGAPGLQEAAETGATADACRERVESERAEPRSLGKEGPKPHQVPLNPVSAQGTFGIALVVDEFGRVTDGSIVVSGDLSQPQRRALERDVLDWTFEPGRVDGCAVPARFDMEWNVHRIAFHIRSDGRRRPGR